MRLHLSAIVRDTQEARQVLASASEVLASGITEGLCWSLAPTGRERAVALGRYTGRRVTLPVAEILVLGARGLSGREIARRLGISKSGACRVLAQGPDASS